MAQQEITPAAEAKFFAGVRRATEFFAGTADVHRALETLTRHLEQGEIPYAIIGAMAMAEYGFGRVTDNVDVLLTREGFQKASALLRDPENEVVIHVFLTGDYPGDGRPKPVVFPDPELEARRGGRVRLLPLEKLIELKLASGMSAPHRLRDLADVLEMIRICDLPADLASRLDESVREKYRELWNAAREARDDEER